MARTSAYLNFSRNTETTFLCHKSIFGGDFPEKTKVVTGQMNLKP